MKVTGKQNCCQQDGRRKQTQAKMEGSPFGIRWVNAAQTKDLLIIWQQFVGETVRWKGGTFLANERHTSLSCKVLANLLGKRN